MLNQFQDNSNKMIYYVKGNWFERSDFIQSIKAKLPGCEFQTFDNQVTFAFIKQSIMQNDCFSIDSKSIYIINEWPKCKGKKTGLNEFLKFIPDIPKNKIVIFNNIKTSSQKFIDLIEKRGKVVTFLDKVSKQEASDYLESYFIEKGKQIERNASINLVDSLNVYGNEIIMDNLLLSIKKVENYIGNKKQIKQEDVFPICIASYDYVVWNLFNILDQKDLKECWRFLDNLFLQSSNIETEIVSLLMSLRWRYKLMLSVSSEINLHNSSTQQVQNRLCKMYKLERHGFKERITKNIKLDNKKQPVSMYNPYSIKGLFTDNKNRDSKGAIFKYEYNQLLLINYAIDKIFIRMRNGCVESEKKLLFDIVILVIAGTFKSITQLDFLNISDKE